MTSTIPDIASMKKLLAAHKSIDSKIVQNKIHQLYKVLKEETKISLDEKIKILKQSLAENKIKFHYATERKEISEILFGLLSDDKNILLDFTDELLETNVFQELAKRELKFFVAHSFFSDLDKIQPYFKPSDALKTINLTDAYSYLEKIKKLSMDSTLGITGADFIIADMGSIFIIDKSGYRGVLCTAPQKHYVIVSLDKLFMSFLGALQVVVSLIKAIDQEFSRHFFIINNPSRTGDIEKIIVYGAHGPRSLHVILYDGGRNSLLRKAPFKSIPLYPFVLILELVHPELKYIGWSFDLPSVNPISLMLYTSPENADRVVAFTDFVLDFLHRRTEIEFPNELIDAFNIVKENANEQVERVENIPKFSFQMNELYRKIKG